MNVILASQSPRRKELLSWLVPHFLIMPADIDETHEKELDAVQYVERMAREKAAFIAQNHPQDLVIASDTIVVDEGEILGKPTSREDGFRMLRALSGKAHLVYTAVVMQQAEQVVTHLAQAEVTFYALTDAEINQYLDTGDYKDKAGAYGIQNEAGAFVEKLNGDYYSIVGFPVGAVREMLKQFT